MTGVSSKGDPCHLVSCLFFIVESTAAAKSPSTVPTRGNGTIVAGGSSVAFSVGVAVVSVTVGGLATVNFMVAICPLASENVT
mgnify:CR=1 FL=1